MHLQLYKYIQLLLLLLKQLLLQQLLTLSFNFFYLFASNPDFFTIVQTHFDVVFRLTFFSLFGFWYEYKLYFYLSCTLIVKKNLLNNKYIYLLLTKYQVLVPTPPITSYKNIYRWRFCHAWCAKIWHWQCIFYFLIVFFPSFYHLLDLFFCRLHRIEYVRSLISCADL